MFIKLSYAYDDRKLFREPASTCQLAASGFCEERKSALEFRGKSYPDIKLIQIMLTESL